MVFSTHTREENKWYCTFASFKWFFNIQIGEEKVNIAHLWTRRFFLFTQKKKKIDIVHLQAHKWFFYSCWWRKKILCTCEVASGFFNSHIIFKKMILHIYELTSDFLQSLSLIFSTHA
jgi:hypothetical protein